MKQQLPREIVPGSEGIGKQRSRYKMKQQLLGKILPLSFLCMLFVIMLVTVFVQADDYGLTVDESIQDAYGQSVLAWYKTGGRDTSFLTAYGAHIYQVQHGAIFEVIVAEAQDTFGQHWHTRAVVNGLAGVVGIIAIALCGFELGGWWGAFLAALSLWLYPRFFGAIFNNSKDVPFTSAMTLVLWATLVLVRQWGTNWRYIINCILVGFFIGLAAAVRVSAIIWYPILALLPVGWWLRYGRRAFGEKKWAWNLWKQVSAAAIIAAVSFLTMIALWPYIALNPLHNLYDAIVVMRNYPYAGLVPFAGQLYSSDHLPRLYAPTWLVIGSPPAVLLFAGIGGIVVCATLIKKKMIDTKIVMVCLALLIPLGIIVALRVSLYDGLRQFLFVIPPLLLLAVYGFIGLFAYLAQKRWMLAVIGLVLLALASQLQVIKDMHDLHPYEYMYFSPLIGGVPGANGRYDMDYWAVCDKPAAEWLAHNYQKYTNKQSPTVEAPFSIEQVTTYLPINFKPNQSSPDFYISPTRSALDKQFPSYSVIHTESVEGYTACVVKFKPPSASSSLQRSSPHPALAFYSLDAKIFRAPSARIH